MDDCKMEESVSSAYLDRLSELPESLILHILSFLPMRDVVSTTLLSKRWENLWTTLPCLDFSDIVSKDDEPDSHRVRNFVNGALACWKGTKLLKFIVDIKHIFDNSLTGDVNLWVRFAVDNKVEELSIHLMYNYKPLHEMNWERAVNRKNDVYRAPQCLNSCSSIRKLSLFDCNLRIHGSPAWNQLKSLSIDCMFFSESLINQILLGTPQLEVFELSLIENNKNLNIQSTSLKKLKINKYIYGSDQQPSPDAQLRICCPNLETLEISGVFYSKCLFTNVSSLTDAIINITRYSDAHHVGETMRHIFSAFRHVERVTLSFGSLRLLRALKKSLFPPLPNVVLLKVEVYLISLIEMVHLLEIFPNLKMLVIEDLTYQYDLDIKAENCLEFEKLSKSFLLQLKIIEITSDFSKASIFRYVEFLLKHGSMLEKLVIRANGPHHFHRRICWKLQRHCSACQDPPQLQR